MTSQFAPQTQQFATPGEDRLPGCWKLAKGHAVTLRPNQAGVLRIAHGQVWATLDGQTGDYFIGAGEELSLKAGQTVVMESFAPAEAVPAYFSWEPVAASEAARVRGPAAWSQAVVQPLADLRLAAGLAGAALTRLARGLAGLAGDTVAARVRGLLAARAFNAQASASRAHGAIS
jgi:hypothetical protein